MEGVIGAGEGGRGAGVGAGNNTGPADPISFGSEQQYQQIEDISSP